MNYFIQGDSNIFRVNLENDLALQSKTLYVNQVYIKLMHPKSVIKYRYGNTEYNAYSEFEEYVIPDDDKWLLIKHEPFVLERENNESTTVKLSINNKINRVVPELIEMYNDDEVEELNVNVMEYYFNDDKTILEYPANITFEYVNYHYFIDYKMIKVYLDFDLPMFNTIEYMNKSYDRKLCYLLGTYLMTNESFDVYPDTISSQITANSFYLVVKDENENEVPIKYFMLSFKME